VLNQRGKKAIDRSPMGYRAPHQLLGEGSDFGLDRVLPPKGLEAILKRPHGVKFRLIEEGECELSGPMPLSHSNREGWRPPFLKIT
jgi:hypothetical protein